MPYIIAPIYEFFNHNVILYKTVKSATFVNSQDERALPANRKCVCPRMVWYFLYLSLSFHPPYEIRASFSTKVSKSIIVLSDLICKKPVFARDFTIHDFLTDQNTILFFNMFNPNRRYHQPFPRPQHSRPPL